MKTCRECAQALALDQFTRNPRGRDGRRTICRSCDSLQRARRGARPAPASRAAPAWSHVDYWAARASVLDRALAGQPERVRQAVVRMDAA